jgi:hypothetical protein
MSQVGSTRLYRKARLSSKLTMKRPTIADALTPEEHALYDKLPRPPSTTQVFVTNVWVVEWLPAADRRTGHELYEWLNQRRPLWARFPGGRGGFRQILFFTTDLIPRYHPRW